MKKILIIGVAFILVLGVSLVLFKSLRHRSVSNTLGTSTSSGITNPPQASASSSSSTAESSGSITLTISSPSENQTVTKNSIEVTGITSPGAEVSVNEADTTADSNGKFSASINLDEGDNVVVIVANDSKGNFVEKDLNINYTPGQ